MLRIQATAAKRLELVPRHQRLHGAVRDGTHILDDAGGTSAVEEMNKGHGGLERCEVGHEAQVHHLLWVVRREQGAARGAHSHDIRVITEDGQRLPCQSTSGDMEHRRQELARTEVHVGDHEQQSLGGCERRAQGTARESAMQGSGRAQLRLHLPNLHHLAEDVLAAASCKLVHRLAHARRGRNRVDEGYVAHGIGNMSRRRVAIDGTLRLALIVQRRHVNRTACSDLLGKFALAGARGGRSNKGPGPAGKRSIRDALRGEQCPADGCSRLLA
mmetsp:Transcript_99908/g.250475  ORF Transcript_99908/g.250475 Transcript_99908/m.250475 type:complete len:273 (-) Transcript_99908:86-904(-)